MQSVTHSERTWMVRDRDERRFAIRVWRALGGLERSIDQRVAAHLHDYYREPNDLVSQVHIRMPVILPEEHHAKWLGELEDGDLKELLNETG